MAHDVPRRQSAYLILRLYHILRQFQGKDGENMRNSGNLAERLDAAERHLLFQHNPQNTDGWITLAKKDPTTNRFHQYHYQPEELAASLTKWMGEDVYYSQQTFYRPARRIDYVRQLRTLYADLDVYNMNLDPEWVLGKLELEYFRKSIPEPNMVIFSGRGLVLIWNIIPLPYKALPLWRSVENYFVDILKELGADTKATDPARIFRLAGSINSKNNSDVTVQYRHDYRYDIHDLQFDYLPELTPKPNAKKKPGPKPKIIRLFNIYTLHLARAKDIAKLVELRNGEMDGYREYTCFLYRYFTCCFTSDPQRALEETMDLNSQFTHPLPEKEVEVATRSAQRAWEAKSNKKADEIAKANNYPGAGYNIPNKTIIQWLGISPEEQTHMETIIGAGEKRRRNTEAKRKARRLQGQAPRAEYLSKEKSERESRYQEIIQIHRKHPEASQRKLAKLSGYSLGMVNKALATLK